MWNKILLNINVTWRCNGEIISIRGLKRVLTQMLYIVTSKFWIWYSIQFHLTDRLRLINVLEFAIIWRFIQITNAWLMQQSIIFPNSTRNNCTLRWILYILVLKCQIMSRSWRNALAKMIYSWKSVFELDLIACWYHVIRNSEPRCAFIHQQCKIHMTSQFQL